MSVCICPNEDTMVGNCPVHGDAPRRAGTYVPPLTQAELLAERVEDITKRHRVKHPHGQGYCPTCSLLRALALANEHIRLFEESQIPVIPRGAQEKIERLEAELAAARERAQHAEQALEWYADRRNYAPAGRESAYDAVTARDGFDDFGPGARARAALAVLSADTKEAA